MDTHLASNVVSLFSTHQHSCSVTNKQVQAGATRRRDSDEERSDHAAQYGGGRAHRAGQLPGPPLLVPCIPCRGVRRERAGVAAVRLRAEQKAEEECAGEGRRRQEGEGHASCARDQRGEAEGSGPADDGAGGGRSDRGRARDCASARDRDPGRGHARGSDGACGAWRFVNRLKAVGSGCASRRCSPIPGGDPKQSARWIRQSQRPRGAPADLHKLRAGRVRPTRQHVRVHRVSNDRRRLQPIEPQAPVRPVIRRLHAAELFAMAF
jgi:hypothetical protein